MTRLAVGDRVPNTTFRLWDGAEVSTLESETVFAGKKVLVIGVVGAFTPVCARQHLPEFVPYQKELHDAGLVDEVICISAADPFVMRAWGESQGVGDGIVMLSDTDAGFAKALGVDLDFSELGLGTRSERFILLADNGEISIFNVETSPLNVDVTGVAALRKRLLEGREAG